MGERELGERGGGCENHAGRRITSVSNIHFFNGFLMFCRVDGLNLTISRIMCSESSRMIRSNNKHYTNFD